MLNLSQENQNYCFFYSQLPSSDNLPLSEGENDWIESFLNAQTLIKSRREHGASQRQQVAIIQSDQTIEEKEQQGPEIVCKSPRSVFHNFQKHLNVLLKKMMPFKKHKLERSQCGHIALQLWNLFLNIHSYNKKTLRIIFGSANLSSNSQLIDRMVKDFSSLKSFYEKYSPQIISKAQKLLRNGVIGCSKNITLQNIQLRTKISSQCDKFYQYFRNFVDELEQGQLTIRISKKNKIKIIENINNIQQ